MNKTLKIIFYIGMTIFFFYTLNLLNEDTVSLISTYTYDNFNVELHHVTSNFNDEESDITLPYDFHNLNEGDVITINATFTNPERNYLYINNTFTPMKIYNDHDLIYEYGNMENYPSYFQTPVYSSKFVRIDNSNQTISLTFEYTMLDNLETFHIEPYLFGSQSGLFFKLFTEHGFSFLFSLTLILLSLFLIVITSLSLIFEKRIVPFLWISIAALCAGLWILTDCPFTSIVIHNDALIYIVSITSMALFPLPLIIFALSTVHFNFDSNLKVISFFQFTSVSVALFCFAKGLISPIDLNQLFNVLTPFSICCFAVCVLLEYTLHHNKNARRLCVPSIVFAILTLLEFINYRTHFTNMPISFFQSGILFFVVSMGILGGYFVKDAYTLQNKNNEMKLHMNMVDYQASYLKKQSTIMMNASDMIHKYRHDLRHQLTVIKELANSNNNVELNNYLNKLIDDIPTVQKQYCENMAVNAIVAHYASICQKQNISFEVKLHIPKESLIPDTDFCSIFGNLLENATEACNYLENQTKFIKISTHTHFNTLVIRMENSFDGTFTVHEGKYYSRKRPDYGIGLSSIKSISRKHHGDSQFKVEHHTFISSLYLVFE